MLLGWSSVSMAKFMMVAAAAVATTSGMSVVGLLEDAQAQVIYLPLLSSSESVGQTNDEIPLSFTAFGRNVQLKLQINRKLVAPSFQVWRHDEGQSVKVEELETPRFCYYIHQDSTSTAAANLCRGTGHVSALVWLEDQVLEITPLEDSGYTANSASAHLVKRSAYSSSELLLGTDGNGIESFYRNVVARKSENASGNDGAAMSGRTRAQGQRTTTTTTIELALFFDKAGYNLFYPFFDKSELKIRDMLLAYINGVQALYYHPSLGRKIDLALVRLEIMRTQPFDLPHHEGERERLLDSFCRYSAIHNPEGDDDPKHWDMGLYVSGLDFYALEADGTKNGITMGLAPVNGLCHQTYSCVIAELGVTNRFGKPYPSAGFTSVFIAAHEIGHNLGMRHDSSDNSCSKDGYIMSPSRGTQGETIWSSCSREVALGLYDAKPCLSDNEGIAGDRGRIEHVARYGNFPGRKWNAKKQCELLLRDKDAVVVSLENACQALRCKSPHRTGYFYAGPALEGTLCARGSECRGGECSPVAVNPPDPPQSSGGSEWKKGPCKSGCIVGSKGVRNEGPPSCRHGRRTTNCTEESSANNHPVELCEDDRICAAGKRIPAADFAGKRCEFYALSLPEIDPNGGGLQAPHETLRPWLACAVFCRRTDIASFYTPRIPLYDLGLDPYFPDGTWCHRDQRERDYFCLRHHCLPQDFRFYDNYNKDSEPEYDLNGDGDDDDSWSDKDYLEIPNHLDNSISLIL
ncbi:A disintegrin and metalloproteinase with thrombospondin motifs adt-1-like [Venturia canescens]|uniref:A disintegrin and metalloproteinase with thrombospondin motifs adt-1-like n=1 Tax=Venturia canescens TaxID=32260 RepID=UPI001C9D6525|nr:A disintegrin and metalloproteinase with thrombospondin motifs adt-1-like [Venturia canescens]